MSRQEEAEEERSINQIKNYMENNDESEMISDEILDPEILINRATSLAEQRSQEGNGSLDGTVSVFGTPTIRSIKSMKNKASFLKMKLKRAPAPILRPKSRIQAPAPVRMQKDLRNVNTRGQVPNRQSAAPNMKFPMSSVQRLPIKRRALPVRQVSRPIRNAPVQNQAKAPNSQDIG